jgi:23S rRNA (uridine2552-2'-O)-methyltransferase
MGRPYQRQDHFYREAKRQGLRARSAFKIEEIASRFSLLRKGHRVLDLGAAPGGFLKVIAEAVGEKGLVVGLDIVPIASLGKPQVKTLVLDVLDAKAIDRVVELAPLPFDLVTSDAAPKTTGVRITDEARSLELANAALSLASKTLKPGGAFVCKVFMGGDFPLFDKKVSEVFEQVKVVRPEATRGGSFEVYVVGLKRRRSA